MSVEPGPNPQSEFASLQSCFVEGTPEQRARERRIRRRALIISVCAQAAILTAIILVPLFGKPERIALANTFTPIPPYSPSRPPAQHEAETRPTTPRRHFSQTDLLTPPNRIPTRVDSTPDRNPPPNGPSGFLDPAIGAPCPGCIPIADTRVQPERPAEQPHAPVRIRMTHLEPAMLIRRVEPTYPALARQIRASGHVELRAVIATDGTIQSLQVVNGEPLFIQSALDAVRQWRYRPTILNGQPVEIDTFITVQYNLQQ